MGDLHLAQGDLSGGFRINIHRYAGQPIVDSLGLEIAEETEQPGLGTDAETVSVATLKPVLPFWTDVELSYGAGRVLGWRATRDTGPAKGWLTGHETLPVDRGRDGGYRIDYQSRRVPDLCTTWPVAPQFRPSPGHFTSPMPCFRSTRSKRTRSG